MRVQLRETGSILVRASRDDVLAMLQSTMRDGSLVAPDRLEGAGCTYILRESPAGTRVIHARTEPAAVTSAPRGRDELRRAVEADLYRLQKALEPIAR